MVVKSVAALVAACLPILAGAAGANFDTDKYCRDVAAQIGGSYVIEESCRKQEREARLKLSKRQVPSRVETYCRDVAQTIGGSYVIMDSCIDQELAAKGRLQ